MADVTITQLTSIGAGLDSADEVPIWDVSGGVSRKTTVAQMNVGLATLAGGNSFTGMQVVASQDGVATFQIANADLGSGTGPMLYIGRNTNATTPAPGALYIGKVNPFGNCYLWPDDSGIWRTALNAAVTSANRNGGTVVGAQTSALDAKDLIGEVASIEDVLKAVQKGAKAVRRFKYKAQNTDSRDEETKRTRSRPFNGEAFEGVVIDFAPRYGMDEDEAHPAGKSLNMVNAIGDLLRAVAWLVEREKARGA